MIRCALASLSLALCLLQAEDAARTVAAINPVHEPGVYGAGKCLSGVTLAGDAKQADVLVDVDGVRFKGVALPDRASSRILVKVVTMTTVSKDGQVQTREVDGYLQDSKDGKPGLLADFAVAENALSLKAGSIGKLVLLRSVTFN